MASAKGIRAGRAYVELGVNDKLAAGLKRAGAQLRAFGAMVTMAGLKTIALGSALAAPFIAATKMMANMGSEMVDAAARTGSTVEALSELKFAAEQSGASFGDLELGLRRMQKVVTQAGEDTKAARESLAELGLTAGDLASMAPDEQFERIADGLSRIVSPAERATYAMEIFGRGGTALLPLMQDGARGVRELRAEARRLGLQMSTKDGVAAERFGDSMAAIWAQVKMTAFHIGSALVPDLVLLANWFKRVAAQGIAWLKENRGLVVSIAKVTVGVIAAGVALVAFGVTMSVLGTTLGVAATALTAVGVVVGAILTPIGLVSAALIGGVAAWATYTDAGGKATDWLMDRFGELGKWVADVVGGIRDALAGGDLAAAAKILWAALNVAWTAGTAALESIWLKFKAGFIKIAYGAFYGVQAAWEITQNALAVAWIETTAFLSRIWTRFAAGVQSVWESTQNWLENRWHDLFALFDETYDVAAAKALANRLSGDKQKQIEDAKNAALADQEVSRKAKLDSASQQHEANLARIGEAFDTDAAKADAAAKIALALASGELLVAQAELSELIAQAQKSERDLALDYTNENTKRPFDADDVSDAVQQTASKVQFGGLNAELSLGGGGRALDKIAIATDATAKGVRELVREVQTGGAAFI
jgi:hypothetical protein